MIRRTPEAIVIAHVMDQSRKSLYVEGLRDRLFLSWLLGDQADNGAVIAEIDFVEIPESGAGGNRGRLIKFAEQLGTKDVAIRMFADADWDRVLGRCLPQRVWLTDYRDLEGYILCERCLDKLLRLGIGTERVSARNLLAAVLNSARPLGALRLASDIDGLNLPFQNTDLTRHVAGEGEAISVDLASYLRALLQNAGISLSRLQQINRG